MTYFEQVLCRFDKNSQFKKASPALKKKSLKHLNHSTKKIKKHLNSKEIFTFRELKETEIIRTFKELPKTKPVHSKTFQ